MSEPVEERVIHNGVILNDVPGVKTITAAGPVSEATPTRLQVPKGSVEDVDPEALAAAMAGVISAAFDEVPKPTPMVVVNRLLMLTTKQGHKVVWTRFDIHQLFAMWTNKLQRGAQR